MLPYLAYMDPMGYETSIQYIYKPGQPATSGAKRKTISDKNRSWWASLGPAELAPRSIARQKQNNSVWDEAHINPNFCLNWIFSGQTSMHTNSYIICNDWWKTSYILFFNHHKVVPTLLYQPPSGTVHGRSRYSPIICSVSYQLIVVIPIVYPCIV